MSLKDLRDKRNNLKNENPQIFYYFLYVSIEILFLMYEFFHVIIRIIK